jgi:hypothetical protein
VIFSTTASVFIALRRDESLAPKGIIKGGDWGEGLDDSASLFSVITHENFLFQKRFHSNHYLPILARRGEIRDRLLLITLLFVRGQDTGAERLVPDEQPLPFADPDPGCESG